MEQFARFALGERVQVPDRHLTLLRLLPTDARLARLDVDEEGVVTFSVVGWFEVLLTVEWDSANRSGRRFSHTAIPDRHPLHSEAIEADVLIEISGGKQLLRGNTLFGPKGVHRIQLEVWQDSGAPVDIENASLEIRPLPNA